YEPPKAYHLLLHAEKEPLFDEMKPGQIVILKEDEQLTAYWLENGKIVNRSFSERVVPGILGQLPDKGKLSNNLELIEAVI
ncbi:hypothetical protein G4A25_28765, partial [Escherichia coli]|uniref:hypothetical protein n=1 Tax=Escherichia coli TaxID=562 RepID=UPI0015C765A9